MTNIFCLHFFIFATNILLRNSPKLDSNLGVTLFIKENINFLHVFVLMSQQNNVDKQARQKE